MQNGEATLCLPPTKGAKALKKPQPNCESRQVIAIQGSQFQTGEAAKAAGAQHSRSPLLLLTLKLGACRLGSALRACPAIEARKGRVRRMERTTQSCTARLPTIRR